MHVNVKVEHMAIEGQQAVWLSAQPCAPMEVAGESFNKPHIEQILVACGGHLGVSLIAWLAPEPQNQHDPNAVMVWIRGAKAGYVPREAAVIWQQVIKGLQDQSRLPVACAAHVRLPTASESGFQLVLWLPPLPGQTGQAMGPQQIAQVMAQAEQARIAAGEVPAAVQTSGPVKGESCVARAERMRREHKERLEKIDARKARQLATFTPKYGPEIAASIVFGKPWMGATEEMIIEAFGAPTSSEEKVLKNKTKRVLSYKKVNDYGVDCPTCEGTGIVLGNKTGRCPACKGTGDGKAIALKIQIEDGLVVGWEDKR